LAIEGDAVDTEEGEEKVIIDSEPMTKKDMRKRIEEEATRLSIFRVALEEK